MDHENHEASLFPLAPPDRDDYEPPKPFPCRRRCSYKYRDDGFQRRYGPTYNYPRTTATYPRTQISDACCLITLITLCCFGYLLPCMKLMFGVYGPKTYNLGPHASILINPNPLFVENVKVERLDFVQNKLMLYGFDGSTPPLSDVTRWSENRKVVFPGASHKEWMYYLNVGSRIDISYNVTSSVPSTAILVIADGVRGLTDWVEDPEFPKSTLLWKPIYGIGEVGHNIRKSGSYYIAVGNLNPAVVEVELQIRITALLYDTKNANYKSAVSRVTRVLKRPFTGGNSALLAFSDPKPGIDNGKSLVQVSYGPRWITYLGGAAGVIVLVSMAVHAITKGQTMAPQAAAPPLIPPNDDDDDVASYDSLAQDYDDGPNASDNESDTNMF